MKAFFLVVGTWIACSAGVLIAGGEFDFPKGRVLTFEPGVLQGLVLETQQATAVFATKNGGQRLGVFPAETRLQLVAMTERAYKVRGKAKHGRVAGWVAPKHLISNDTELQANLTAYYQRTMMIEDLVAAKEVAIGMTAQEVKRSVGEPTKRKDKVTKEGSSASWEYIQSEEKKHYVYSKDKYTGMVYRQYSHSTVEVTEQLTVDFEDGLVSAITRLKDDSGSKVRIVVAPVVFRFHL